MAKVRNIAVDLRNFAKTGHTGLYQTTNCLSPIVDFCILFLVDTITSDVVQSTKFYDTNYHKVFGVILFPTLYQCNPINSILIVKIHG